MGWGNAAGNERPNVLRLFHSITAATMTRKNARKAPVPYVSYSRELADRICDDLASGLTLRAVCRQPGMPTETAVRYWALNDIEGFFERYDRSRQVGCDARNDMLQEIADGALPEDAPLLKIKSDNMKWYMMKVHPRRFGERALPSVPAGVRRVTFDFGDRELPDYQPTPKLIEGEFSEVEDDG